jgi:16S rRNA (guanine527-N7)-methyltransferase
VTLLPPGLFRSVIPGLGRALSEQEGHQADKYLKLLIKWQKTQRLVGSVEPEWLVENVVLDSLYFLAALPKKSTAIADLGSGAGIPGVILSIVRPGSRFALIESRQRRASFLTTVVRELRLSNVEVIGQRAEDLVPDLAGAFDAITMRCAGDFAALTPVAMPLLRPGGVVIASGKSSDESGIAVVGLSGRRRSFRRLVRPA